MSAGRDGDHCGDFAASRDLGVAQAEAGDFRAAAKSFRDALAAASRLPSLPAIHTTMAITGPDAGADMGDGAAATVAAGGPVPPTIGPAAACDGLSVSAVAGSATYGCGHGHPTASPGPPGGAPSRRHLAAVHDMMAQCLMELAAEGGGGGDDASMAAGLPVAGLAGPAPETATEAVAGLQAVADSQVWEEAWRSAVEAVRLSPRWVPARLTYARCLRNCGLLDDALRELNGAAQILAASRAAIHVVDASTAAELAPVLKLTAGAAAAVPGSPQVAAPAALDSQGAAADAGPNAAKQPQPQSTRVGGCSHLRARPGNAAQPAGDDPWGAALDAPDPGLESEVAEELSEVAELWQQRLARNVGLPGLRIPQDAGAFGEGPGRRVWECGILLAAYLVRQAGARGPLRGGSAGGVDADADRGMSPRGRDDAAAINLTGARVLELGCGGGLVGITAASCGAHCVLTDLPPVLPAAESCAAANATLIRAAGGSVSARSLDWHECGGAGGDGGGDGVGAADAAAGWLQTGQGPWAAMGADDQQLALTGTAEAAGGLRAEEDVQRPGRTDGFCKLPPGGHGRRCWVLGADLVYSVRQVDVLVGLLVALRRAAQRLALRTVPVGGPLGVERRAGKALAALALEVPAHVAAVPAPQTSGQEAVEACMLEEVVAPSCTLLLGHKNRSEVVSQELWSRLCAAGMQLRELDLAGEEDLQRLSAQLPSVKLYQCELW